MTPAERQLLAAVHRHARTTGWTHNLLGWTNPTRTAAIAADPAGELSILEGWNGAWSTWPRIHRVDTVRQAVDLLVALGHLPARFSSAYADGYGEGVKNGVLAMAGVEIQSEYLPVGAS